jgi:hypothetical protein
MKHEFIEPQFSDNYELKWLIKTNPKMGTIVGKVINYNPADKLEFYINIEKSDLDVNYTGYTIIATTWQKNKKTKTIIPIIGVTQFFINYPELIREGLIWHEVGHIHYKHVLRNKLTQKELQEQRLFCVKNNDVLPMELEADVFAAKRIGKLRYIEVLKYVKDHRPFETTNAYSEIGRKEYDIRVKKIIEIV